MKRVLVTGGAGFIGSHLCKKLIAEENHVICLDNLFSGSYNNIADLCMDSHFTFINESVIQPFDFDVDEIYNLACPASPIYYQEDPIATAKTNFLGALNTLELARKTGARIVQASTSEVYGDPLTHPQMEEYRGNVNVTGPRACYDEGKRIAETLFFDYMRQYGMDICVIRIFNTYGPNMQKNDGRVISNFIVQALNNQDITVFGDGTQTRSFCYIRDMVEGITRTMAQYGFAGPVNLGNPEEISIGSLAEKIIHLTNSKSKIVFRSLPQDDPRKRRPNIKLAEEFLHWKPDISLDVGLRNTIDYFVSLKDFT